MNSGRIEIISETKAPIVEIQALKDFCYVDGNADDSLLEEMEVAARKKVEGYLRRPLLPQNARIWFDKYVAGVISIPFGKLTSVEKISTWSFDNVETEFGIGNYFVDTSLDQEGRVMFYAAAYGTRPVSTVSIDIINGYADVDSIPQLIKEGIKSQVSFWFENREMYGSNTLSSSIKSKLHHFRIMKV